MAKEHHTRTQAIPKLEKTRKAGKNLQRYLLAGVVTVIPLWITWWVFNFVLSRLSALGTPIVRGAGRLLMPYAPAAAEYLLSPRVQFVIAVGLTLIFLYLLGWFASKVIGRRLIGLFDALMHRIPIVERIYGSARKLINALGEQPGSVQRVVLIPFPTPEMRAVGFVTKTFVDADTGKTLVAIYVPTTPNPTSGYMEIVPVENVVPTEWSVDEAMSFIISGGAIGPEHLRFNAPRQDAEQEN